MGLVVAVKEEAFTLALNGSISFGNMPPCGELNLKSLLSLVGVLGISSSMIISGMVLMVCVVVQSLILASSIEV